MKKPFVGAIIAVIAVIIIAGVLLATGKKDSKSTTSTTSNTTPSAEQTPPTQSTTSTESQPAADQSAVTIQNFAFNPGKITVKAGTKVTWTQQDDTRHNVMPDNPTDEFKAGPLLSKGETYNVTFNTPGTYTYHCEPHPYMKGTVVVTQ